MSLTPLDSRHTRRTTRGGRKRRKAVKRYELMSFFKQHVNNVIFVAYLNGNMSIFHCQRHGVE